MENSIEKGKRSRASLDDSDDIPPETLKKQKLSHEHGLSLDNADNDEHRGPIILNVGGTIYHTTLQTLTGYQSMLKARFSSRYAMKPSYDGSYFVDGDGKLFKYILKYLRTGTLLLPKTWKRSDIWEFYIETKYFMIDSLFNKVLLKLFNSHIMHNPALKLNIITKIGETLQWNQHKTMESLYEWERIGSATGTSGWGITHCLYLFQAENKIYGLFMTRFERGNSGNWFLDFQKCFAFNCGASSSHFLSDHKDIVLDFEEVRKLTDDEKKSDIDDDVSSDDITWYLPYHPVTVRGQIKKYDKPSYSILQTDTYTDWKVKYFEKATDKYRKFSNSELWSIPT